MKFESLRRHPRAAIGIVALLAGSAALEAVGYAQNPTYDVPPNTCISPIASSNTYVDPGTNLVLQTQTGLFTTGVVAHGFVPPGVFGVQASFKNPHADDRAWDRHASKMIKPDATGSFALKMAIGGEEVEFGVRFIAPVGTPACDATPGVAYTYKDGSEYFNASGDLPWPNWANRVSNIF